MELKTGFDVARDRLADLALGGWLLNVSREAYGSGITGFVRVGPAPGLSKLVRVHARRLPATPDHAGLAIRWEAVGQAGALFPVLDADITVRPTAGGASTLALAAVYRPPLVAIGAGLDRAVLSRIASSTARAFLNRVAEAILHAGMPAAAKGAATMCTKPALPPT
jgi:hypothetical protein